MRFPIKRSLLFVIFACIAAAFCTAQPAHAATWQVDRTTDDVTDGSGQIGSLRYVLAHVTSGDVVTIHSGLDKIAVGSPLTVPAGVIVGNGCTDYTHAWTNLEALFNNPFTDPVVNLGAGAQWRSLNIAGGRISLKVTGANVDVCGTGLGLEIDGDGNTITIPPTAAALIVDGDHATIRHGYINGPVTVSANGSDSRIGDTLTGSGDTNMGVRDASVTVLADNSHAAQRVTIRDPFPRALLGMSTGSFGGDDNPLHANNWARTPAIASAVTADNYATVQIQGTANPNSLVDIYFDTQVDVVRQPQVQADASGHFSFSGALTSQFTTVSAASTLNDPAHAGRIGSSSPMSAATPITTTGGSSQTATKLAFVTQPGGANVNAALSPQPHVAVQDVNGATVTNYSGSVTLSIKTGTGTTGAILNGTTTVAVSSGIASFSGLSIDTAGIGYVLQAMSTGLTAADSTAFAVTAAPPPPPTSAHLVFTTQPGDAIANAPFGTQPVVAVKDSNNQTLTGYSGSVTVSLKEGSGINGATLSGTTTLAFVNGVAAYTDLALNIAGEDYVLIAASDDLVQIESDGFEVSAPGEYVGMRLRTTYDMTIDAAAPVLDADLTISNHSGTALPAGARLTFVFKGLSFDAKARKADSLQGGATWQKLGTHGGTATLNSALAQNGRVTLHLHLTPLTKARTGRSISVQATLAVKRKVNYQSNSISPRFGATNTDVSHGKIQPLSKTMTKKGLLVRGEFFAAHEPVLVVTHLNGQTTLLTITADSRGRISFVLANNQATVSDLIGQWSGTIGRIAP